MPEDSLTQKLATSFSDNCNAATASLDFGVVWNVSDESSSMSSVSSPAVQNQALREQLMRQRTEVLSSYSRASPIHNPAFNNSRSIVDTLPTPSSPVPPTSPPAASVGPATSPPGVMIGPGIVSSPPNSKQLAVPQQHLVKVPAPLWPAHSWAHMPASWIDGGTPYSPDE